MANITGTWLGTFWQKGKPTRFEATFIQNGNLICGNILDDDYLGEAILQGEAVGRNISFVKIYLAITEIRASVNNNGTISEDELRKYITVQLPKNVKELEPIKV
ncbi:hypothetical protein APA_1315 [Pseudanabaena sp. lw0831]|uniref:hypothetical protein n=1 Tax=Pseudanabaena sp. lw0831 TaxID=1357935 RepID=UPI001A22C0F6|nr:hypothetical protein [Pseudanabaena sp. lw0831]GBO53408.1 hypothetical protein APA_1315 [Pseudanabaena sp. lw0831]